MDNKDDEICDDKVTTSISLLPSVDCLLVSYYSIREDLRLSISVDGKKISKNGFSVLVSLQELDYIKSLMLICDDTLYEKISPSCIANIRYRDSMSKVVCVLNYDLHKIEIYSSESFFLKILEDISQGKVRDRMKVRFIKPTCDSPQLNISVKTTTNIVKKSLSIEYNRKRHYKRYPNGVEWITHLERPTDLDRWLP